MTDNKFHRPAWEQREESALSRFAALLKNLESDVHYLNELDRKARIEATERETRLRFELIAARDEAERWKANYMEASARCGRYALRIDDLEDELRKPA